MSHEGNGPAASGTIIVMISRVGSEPNDQTLFNLCRNSCPHPASRAA